MSRERQVENMERLRIVCVLTEAGALGGLVGGTVPVAGRDVVATVCSFRLGSPARIRSRFESLELDKPGSVSVGVRPRRTQLISAGYPRYAMLRHAIDILYTVGGWLG